MPALKGKALEQLRRRDQREADRVERAKQRMARALSKPSEGNIETFMSLVDTSDGPDGCHHWTGHCRWNHSISIDIAAYRYGYFVCEGIKTNLAHRIMCAYSYALPDLPTEINIAPLCGNHLCMNLKHLFAWTDSRNTGAPVAEYFVNQTAATASRANLQAMADAILGVPDHGHEA